MFLLDIKYKSSFPPCFTHKFSIAGTPEVNFSVDRNINDFIQLVVASSLQPWRDTHLSYSGNHSSGRPAGFIKLVIKQYGMELDNKFVVEPNQPKITNNKIHSFLLPRVLPKCRLPVLVQQQLGCGATAALPTPSPVYTTKRCRQHAGSTQ